MKARAVKLPPEPEAEIQRSILVIDGWVPPSANKLWKAPHWSVGHKLKLEAWQTVACAAYLARPRIPKATGKRRVSVAVTMAGRGRLMDPDNTLKCVMDALKVNRLIVDDSSAWVEIGGVTVERGKAKRTVVTLEDIGS